MIFLTRPLLIAILILPVCVWGDSGAGNNGSSIAVPPSTSGLSSDSSGNLRASTAHDNSVPYYCSATNSGNAFSCSTSPSFTPQDGDQIIFNAGAPNTGAATLSVNGITAAPITKNQGQPLIANDYVAYHLVVIIYTGASWELQTPTRNEAANFVATDSGTANNYIVSIIPPPPVGSLYYFQAANTNTGASTITIDGTSYPIYLPGTTTNIPAGYIQAGQVVQMLKQ